VSETTIDVGGDMLASSTENAGVAGKYQVKTKNPQEGSDLWAAVAEALGGLKSEEGLLRINRNAGVIYMADSPRKVAAMVRFLDSLSNSLNRQVFVEARIMEVHLNEENQYGIDWSDISVGFTDSNNYMPEVFALNFNDSGLIAKTDQSRFAAMLDFLKKQGDVRVLSNPHISVMNRQTALLTIGFQYPYADIDGVDRDALTSFITIGTSIKRAVLGLQLGLTAQISEDGMISFHIVPTLTRIDREVDVEIPTGGQSAQTISNPVIDLRELATTVRVRDGDSFIMAGLIRKIKTVNHESLPILGDLPLVGPLFRHMKDSEENTELVILMTPYIRDDA
jgi:MSHA biogenesis protein MshL